MNTLKRLLLAALVAMAFAAPAGAQSRVNVHLTWQKSPIGTGQSILGVVLDIADHWHVQAGKGSGDDAPPYRPTNVTLTLPDGWVADDPLWPVAQQFSIGTGPFAQRLKGYEGRVLIAVPVDVPQTATADRYDITVEVAYQACDDRICEMPTSATASSTVQVAVPAATDQTPSPDADLFQETLARHATDPPATPDPAMFGQGQRARAQLLWYDAKIVPDSEAMLGVLIHIAPNWHIQAGKGSGDDKPPYIPTTIDVTPPDGWEVLGTLWPEAHDFTLGSGEFSETLAGYSETVLAVVPLQVPQATTPGDYPVKVTLGYQACDDRICEAPTSIQITGDARVVDAQDTSITTPLDATRARMFEQVLSRSADGALVEETEVQVPEYKPIPRFGLRNFKWWGALLFVVLSMIWMAVRTVQITTRPVPRTITIVIAVIVTTFSTIFVWQMTTPTDLWKTYSTAAFEQARAQGKRTLLKFTADWCANCHVNERIILANKEAMAELKAPGTVAFKIDFSGENPEGRQKLDELGSGGIPCLAIYQPGSDEPIVIRGLLAGADPVISALRGQTTEVGENDHVFNFLGWQFKVGSNATLLILVLALLAGFFLNFTPCVLPVIPLKIMSLQAHANNPRRCFFLGFIFGLGIVTAFAVLGVLIAGFIGGIEKLDWGGMFSYWWFSGIVGIVVGVMGLGMLGLFVARLPKFVYMFDPRSDTASGSFFMGIFTAVLSTPCTGPLLGATIAWVILQPQWLAFVTFVVMGIGMAFPYVLLTARPSWLDRLPRTGPGSELVKQVMGLLLLAVATFFVSISIQALTT
jgi:cytochrome c biogenesis protein CcdA/DsbC/DsbD-like thiol-disulfide interchange protein